MLYGVKCTGVCELGTEGCSRESVVAYLKNFQVFRYSSCGKTKKILSQDDHIQTKTLNFPNLNHECYPRRYVNFDMICQQVSSQFFAHVINAKQRT